MTAMSRFLARVFLVAALVLSQALYAGHSVVHSDGDRSGCQVCLQASSGSAVAVCAGAGLPHPLCAFLPPPGYYSAAAIPVFTNPHPPRAPPVFFPA